MQLETDLAQQGAHSGACKQGNMHCHVYVVFALVVKRGGRNLSMQGRSVTGQIQVSRHTEEMHCQQLCPHRTTANSTMARCYLTERNNPFYSCSALKKIAVKTNHSPSLCHQNLSTPKKTLLKDFKASTIGQSPLWSDEILVPELSLCTIPTGQRCLCTGFMWQDFGSRGLHGWPLWRRVQKLPHDK